MYAFKKVVSHYDLSVLSMLVMGFQKKLDRGGGWLGQVNSIQFDFLNLFTFVNPLNNIYGRCNTQVIIGFEENGVGSI